MRRMTPEQIQACFDYAARAERIERRARYRNWIAAACLGLAVGSALFLGY